MSFTGFKKIRTIFVLMTASLLALAACAPPPSTQQPAPEVQALLDKSMIEDLLVDYYTQLGTGGHGFSDFYVEDSILDVNGTIAQGREPIEDLYKSAASDSPAQKGTFRMLLTNLKVVVNGDSATADVIWTGVNSEKVTATPKFVEQGREHDELIKRNGKWYFKHRMITSDGGLSGIFEKSYKPR